jgi:hypothetical protein
MPETLMGKPQTNKPRNQTTLEPHSNVAPRIYSNCTESKRSSGSWHTRRMGSFSYHIIPSFIRILHEPAQARGRMEMWSGVTYRGENRRMLHAGWGSLGHWQVESCTGMTRMILVVTKKLYPPWHHQSKPRPPQHPNTHTRITDRLCTSEAWKNHM